MHIKTMNGGVDYDVTTFSGIVSKVEKWNSTNTTITTEVTGGGGTIKTGWDGRVSGTIEPTSVNTTHTTNSVVNTRLYFEDGSSLTLEDCDFITTEGNEINALFFNFNNEFYPIKVKDHFTGYEASFWDFSSFSKNVLGLKESRLKYYTVLSVIGLGAMAGLYFLLKSWGWWALFIVIVEFFALVFFGTLSFKSLLKDVYNNIFNRHILIDKESEFANHNLLREYITEFDALKNNLIETPTA